MTTYNQILGLQTRQGAASSGPTWHTKVHTLTDANRAMVFAFTNGGNQDLVILSGPWWTGTPINAVQTLIPNWNNDVTALVDSVAVNNCLYVFVATAGSGYQANRLAVYRATYNPSTQSFGTALVQTISTTFAHAPLSVRALYDPTITPLQASHIPGTAGLIHCLVDCGQRWYLFALDPHVTNQTSAPFTPSATKAVAVETSTYWYPELAGPTGVTNMCTNGPGGLFILSAGASAWAGYSATYSATGGPVVTVTNGTSSYLQSSYLAGTSGNLWFSRSTMLAAGFYRAQATTAGGNTVPTSEGSGFPTTVGRWGYDLGTITPQNLALTMPAGTVTATLQMGFNNIADATIAGQVRLYLLTGSVQTGTMTPLCTVPITGTETSVTGSVALGSTSIPAGTHLYAELDLSTPSLVNKTASPFTITLNQLAVTTPVPSSSVSQTLTPNAYVIGPKELPTLPYSAGGAALIPSLPSPVHYAAAPTGFTPQGITNQQYPGAPLAQQANGSPPVAISGIGGTGVGGLPTGTALDGGSNAANPSSVAPASNPSVASTIWPGIDLYVNTGGTVSFQARGINGGYSAVQALATTTGAYGPVNTQIAAVLNNVNGDKAVFYHGNFNISGVGQRHIGIIKRTKGVWSAAVQFDSFASDLGATNCFHWCTASPLAEQNTGPTVVFTSGSSPYSIDYEDAGLGLATAAPTAPTIIPVTAPNKGTLVHGSVAPFNVTGIVAADATTYPWFQLTYANANTYDPLYALSYRENGGTYGTLWTLNGPTSGGSVLFQAPLVATPLTGLHTVNAYTSDTLSGQNSPVGATTYYAVNTPSVLVQTTQITATAQAFVLDYYQADGYAPQAVQLHLIDSLGNAVVDTGELQLGVSQTPTTTTDAFNPSHTVIWLATAPTVGTVYALGLSVGSDAITILSVGALATSPGGHSAYPCTFSGAHSHIHAAGELCCVRITTPAINVYPGVTNNQSYNLLAAAFVAPPQGASWFGTTQATLATAIVTAPPVIDLAVHAVPGNNPVTGGYLRAAFRQKAATGLQLPPVAWNIYQKRSTETAWSLVQSIPAAVGVASQRLYSIPNSVAMDIGITSVGANGVESVMTVYGKALLTFRAGLWFNSPAFPQSCLELGFYNAANTALGTYPLEYEHQQDKDIAQLFNRTAAVITTGTQYALHTSSNPTFVLEVGYEQACLTLLRQWDSHGTVLQIRDTWGNVYYGVIASLKETADGLALYQAVTVELQMTDAGGNGLLGAAG